MKRLLFAGLALAICVPIAVNALSSIRLESQPQAISGANARIEFTSGVDVEEQVFERLNLDAAAHEVQLARVQVAPDRVVWLVTAAPRRFDVHIPRRELAIIDPMQVSKTQHVASCEPKSLGSFRSMSHWDIRCGEGTVLQFDGHSYQPRR